MASLIDMMVMELEGRELLASSTDVATIERLGELLPKLEANIEAEIRRNGFTDIPAIKDRLQLPVQRICRARKSAEEHMIQLACELELEKRL